MDQDKSITAVFEEEPPTEYDLTINTQGEGTTSPSEGIHTFEEGEEVTVEATSAENWNFVEWTGDETGTDPVKTITMDQDKSITAVFEEEEEENLKLLSIDPPEGTVTTDEISTVEGTFNKDIQILDENKITVTASGMGMEIPIEVNLSVEGNVLVGEPETVIGGVDAELVVEEGAIAAADDPTDVNPYREFHWTIE